MSGSSASDDVASDLIDAYLIAVENALVTAGAPRADRQQVLQNLETQISEMLAPHPLPFSEETVRSVLDKLEPPRHFAATYGNGREAATPTPDRFAWRPRIRWPFVAALSCAMLPAGCLLAILAANLRIGGPVLGVIVVMVLAGFVLTPAALWMAYKQLRAQTDKTPGRGLVMKSMLGYFTLAPAVLMALVTAGTDGFALIPFGIVAFVYIQYTLIRRLWRHMDETLPSRPLATISDTNGHGATPPVNTATPMPAM